MQEPSTWRQGFHPRHDWGNYWHLEVVKTMEASEMPIQCVEGEKQVTEAESL